MARTLAEVPDPAPGGDDTDRRRTKNVKPVWLSIGALAIVGVVFGAVVTFGWMIDETHFERPTPEFDDFERQIENLPGIDRVDKERWVEAPTFSNPTSWMSVTVNQAGLPRLLEAACSTDYPDAIRWSVRVSTAAGTEVSLHAAPTAPDAAGGDSRCPDFGLDAVRVVDELDRVAPGVAVQPAVWEDGRLALVALEEDVPADFTHLLPLIEHADDLLAAAGLAGNHVVEINSANLGLILEPGESDRYLALLTELAEDRAVSSYWADGGGTPIDGVEKVQIVAPDDQHAAIEEIIRSSRLHIADLPVRFLEQ
jgi:hypothetical protein